MTTDADVAQRRRARFGTDQTVHLALPGGGPLLLELAPLCDLMRPDPQAVPCVEPAECRECLVVAFLHLTGATLTREKMSGRKRPDELTVGTRADRTLWHSKRFGDQYGTPDPSGAWAGNGFMGMVVVVNHDVIPDAWQIRRGGDIVARGVLLDP